MVSKLKLRSKIDKTMLEINYIRRGNFESRILEVNKGDKNFLTPTYFPSISSATSRQQILSLIKLCISECYPRLLVSAYDLYPMYKDKKLAIKDLKKYVQNNILFIDSGTFESYWLKDNKWNFNKYKKIMTELADNLYTSFDIIPRPDDNSNNISLKIENYMKKSKLISKDNNCIMIIHGNSPSQLIEIVKKNIKYSSMFAIPERECGNTLDIKLKTIQKIRKILSKKDPANILHILGCGNPLSIGLFSFMGADSFDSTDWSRWIINPKTLQFTDLHHIDLINCKCRICKNKRMDMTMKAFLHNLLFYQQFMKKLRTAILNNKDFELFKKYVEPKTFSKISKLFNT